MVRRFLFLIIIFFSFSGLAWWSNELRYHKDTSAIDSPEKTALRQQLVEILDRLAVYQHYYKANFGRFTKILSRLGLQIPAELKAVYDFRVSEATTSSFQIMAISEASPRESAHQIEIASVNEAFRFQSNFEMPEPRVEFLKSNAKKVLRQLLSTRRPVKESAIFSGYFKYDIKKDSDMNDVAVATGIKFPVANSQVSLAMFEREGDSKDSSINFELSGRPKEEVELALTVFRGETGRVAQNWFELEQVAKPEFLELLETSQQILPSAQQKLKEIDFAERKVSSVRDKVIEVQPRRSADESTTDAVPELEIEPLYPQPGKDRGGRLTK
jgi:hypothetical protein